MKELIQNRITFIAAIAGLCIGTYWGYKTNWDYEPILIIVISFIEIIGFILVRKLKESEDEKESPSTNNNTNNVSVNVNVKEQDSKENEENKENTQINRDRIALIESKKNKVNILFIDDDTKFKIVKILKDSGWKKTKSIVDVKSIDVKQIQEADILFIDIRGVGKILGLEHEGLDLAYMIKRKYKEKKVVIYSANKNSNSFHAAWNIIDSRLEKNALPDQFTNLVDNYSLEYYN